MQSQASEADGVRPDQLHPDRPEKRHWPAWGKWIISRDIESTDLVLDCWNGRYSVRVREAHYALGDFARNSINTEAMCLAGVVLQICNHDQSAHHDWRDFQRIKSELLGPEWWGFEVYPAESELIDPSNAFYLWCAESLVFRARYFGHTRWTQRPEQAIAPQRAFEPGENRPYAPQGVVFNYLPDGRWPHQEKLRGR